MMINKIIKFSKRNKYEIISAVTILIVFAVGVVFGALVLG
jgi:hypothetical protein